MAWIRLFRWNNTPGQQGNEYLDIEGTRAEVDKRFLELVAEDPNWRIFAWKDDQ